MIVTVGFSFALGVLFPVLMDSFNETRERTGKWNYLHDPWTSTLVCGIRGERRINISSADV